MWYGSSGIYQVGNNLYMKGDNAPLSVATSFEKLSCCGDPCPGWQSRRWVDVDHIVDRTSCSRRGAGWRVRTWHKLLAVFQYYQTSRDCCNLMLPGYLLCSPEIARAS